MCYVDTVRNRYPQCELDIHSSKNIITSKSELTYCNVKLPLRLACDAFPLGLGGTINGDEQEHPIANRIDVERCRKLKKHYS